MTKYNVARKYLRFGIVWEHKDSASKFKEAIVGTLFRIEEAIVVGEKVTYLHILSDVTNDLFKWNAAEVRIIQPPGSKRRRSNDDYDADDDDNGDEEDE